MTPAMPITIPNIVRNDLSLFDPKIESAVIIYCARPETALLAKCEDRACQGTIAEKKRNFNRRRVWLPKVLLVDFPFFLRHQPLCDRIGMILPTFMAEIESIVLLNTHHVFYAVPPIRIPTDGIHSDGNTPFNV